MSSIAPIATFGNVVPQALYAVHSGAYTYVPNGTLLVPASIGDGAHGGSGQAQNSRVFTVREASGEGPFTTYPPEHGEDNEKQLLYTYGRFHDPASALGRIPGSQGTWTAFVEVPTPDDNRPTLLGLSVLIKYATTFDTANSTIQTDVILTTHQLRTDTIITGAGGYGVDLGIYTKGSLDEYAPRMIKHEEALRLSTNLAIKSNTGGDQWSHYIENQDISPNVRVGRGSHLYIAFHVAEYCTIRTLRTLSIEASAIWQKEDVELKAKAKAKEEADKQAKKEEEEKQARDEARKWMEDAKKWMEDDREAKAEEKRVRDEARRSKAGEEKRVRGESKQARQGEHNDKPAVPSASAVQDSQPATLGAPKPTISSAPAVADADMQALIKEKAAQLGRTCPQGFAWQKAENGYKCEAGGHFLTFEELEMN